MLFSTTPSKIRPVHLERQTFIYIRQSTLFQVREHTASTARQYDLAQRAPTPYLKYRVYEVMRNMPAVST